MNNTIWQDYERALMYQTSMSFSTKWPLFTRFIEGEQWPAATEKTKYMPRPVINQCDFIVENKQSNILSQKLKMIFAPDELPTDGSTDEIEKLAQAAKDYSDCAANTWTDLDQDALNEDLVNDALSLGTGIAHYFFDPSITGGSINKYSGALRGEAIDPLDFFVGNPQLRPTQTQKQPWIIIRTREDTDRLKEVAKKNGTDWDKIQSDTNVDEQYDSAKTDIDKANKTTALTKYYKKNGQVYWTKVTKTGVVQKDTALSPNGAKAFTLYPIEILVFKTRRKCAYGRSIIEDIIPNQMSLNWGLGMLLLSVQQTSWPKLLVKTGALMQKVTNEPGEVIEDHSGSQAYDGIKYMQPPNFSQMPLMITEKLLEFTRQITGTTEVTSGEVMGANMAASAIIALQNQAKKPNEGYQNKLMRSLKNIGRIWEEFYKVYYNMPRPISSLDEEGKQLTRTFVGSDYADLGFGLNIDIGPASVFSESLQMSILDNMANRGWIDKYQYAKYTPNNMLPQDMKQDFEKEKAMVQAQAKEQAGAGGGDIMSALTPEEQDYLKQNPNILNSIK